VEKLEAESVSKKGEAQTVASEIQEKVAWADQEQKSYDKMEKEKAKVMLFMLLFARDLLFWLFSDDEC
jgi:hypothetical protein